MTEPPIILLIIGIILICIEILILQMVIGWLIIIGGAALLSALLLWLLPDIGWFFSILLFCFIATLSTLLLLKPVKRWQTAASPMPPRDIVGHKVVVTEAVSADQQGKITWSGTQWNARLDSSSPNERIEVDQEAEIVSMTGITLIVK